jgi:4-amino-4-deoxy-L-arabinose transferase-like glycosyltransferase
MHSRGHALAAGAALAAAAGFLSFWRLSDAPIFLGRDEVFVGLSGHAIATTGRDLEGRVLPLYFFSSAHGNWWSPVLPYAIAAVLKIAPLSEASIRSPMAIAAVINVIVAFAAGRLLFERDAAVWGAALVMLLAPLQIIESRFANDTGLPATFAALWALAAIAYARHGGVWKLAAAGAALGAGCFCYVGAVPLMPLYALVTVVALALRRDRARSYVAFAAGFLVPAVLGAVWLAAHPAVLETTFLHYQNERFGALDRSAVGTLASVRRLADVASLYARFWNPSVLFMFGAPWLMHSTRRAGVLLFAVAGLLLVGVVCAAARAKRDSRALILLGGFALAAVPASLVDIDEHSALHATWRAIAILPFGAWLAGQGIDFVLDARSTWPRKLALAAAVAVPLALVAAYGVSLPHRRVMTWMLLAAAAIAAWMVVTRLHESLVRAVLVALAVVAAVQFWDFYTDYMGDYQQRFVVETDGNTRDALEAVIDRTPPAEPGRQAAAPAVYLGFRLGAGNWGGYYWRFYVHKQRREDLIARTINDTNASRLDETFVCHLPARSVIATPVHKDPPTDALVESMLQKHELTLDSLVGPVRGRPTYWLVQTTGTCPAE